MAGGSWRAQEQEAEQEEARGRRGWGGSAGCRVWTSLSAEGRQGEAAHSKQVCDGLQSD